MVYTRRVGILCEGTRKLEIDPIDFVHHHGIVLESAKGDVPTLAEEIAGAAIRGSWWSHPKGRRIFAATRKVRNSPDVLICRLLNGKITYVHRRLWPALVRLSSEIGRARLPCIIEQHTATGAHKNRTVPFSTFIPNQIKIEGSNLSREEAFSMLGSKAVPFILASR
jgi:hypothetical protein